MIHLLQQHKQALQQKGLYRKRLVRPHSADLIHFSSNDYLSLTNDWQYAQGFIDGFTNYPTGSGGSMAAGGYHAIHQQLEEAIAYELGVDNALLFSSGYAANLGICALLASLNSKVLIDKAVHASVYDGLKLSGITACRFKHNDMADLTKKIAGSQVIMTEGIFSMSGQQADLGYMAKLAGFYDIPLIVDEAHSFGIMGPKGLGAVAAYRLTPQQVPLRLITFGKAMGFQGAIVAGHVDWIDALYQQARSQLYSTAISPAVAYGILQQFIRVLQADDRRQALQTLIKEFKQMASASPLVWQVSDTPVQQLRLGCPHRALDYANRLKQQGIFCTAMREPTVSKLETGLRVVLNAGHKSHDLERFFQALHGL